MNNNYSNPLTRKLTPLETAIGDEIVNFSFSTVGGTCAYYNIMAQTLLHDIADIETTLIRGGMLYRAGKDELDVVAWCDGNNRARDEMQHFWLVTGTGDLIDFSSHAWHREANADPLITSGEMAAINWQKLPPQYVWTPHRNVIDSLSDRFKGLPRIGKAFYNVAEIVDESDRFAELRRVRVLIAPAVFSIKFSLKNKMQNKLECV